MAGFRVGVSGIDPIREAQKVQKVRDAVGEEVWFGVSANHGLDFGTALAFGRFLEEELDADWFEDPISVDDVDDYRRLSRKLDIPIAAGSSFPLGRFPQLISTAGAGILRPDIFQLGGITSTVKLAAFGTAHHRPVVPVLLPEVSVHLACGLASIQGVEYVRWLEPLWKQGPIIRDGKLVPPAGSGLGLELDDAAVKRFAI